MQAFPDAVGDPELYASTGAGMKSGLRMMKARILAHGCHGGYVRSAILVATGCAQILWITLCVMNACRARCSHDRGKGPL